MYEPTHAEDTNIRRGSRLLSVCLLLLAPGCIEGILPIECVFDSACDDRLFCNGAEKCVAGVCTGGPAPCSSEQRCDETNDACMRCIVDADCDDELFCNGNETCANADCTAGTNPCSNGLMCNESTASCVSCLTDGDCSDGIDCSDDTCVAGECVQTANDALCPAESPICLIDELGEFFIMLTEYFGCSGCCNPCRSQCELCYICDNDIPIEDFPKFDVQKALVQGLVSDSDCNYVFPFAVVGVCGQGVLFLGWGFGLVSETHFYDRVNGSFIALETGTDCDDPICHAIGYWPAPAPCDMGIVTEVLCGRAFDVGELYPIHFFGEVPCNTDEDCEDFLYCDGTESCVEGICQFGTGPCPTDQRCDEVTNACVPCLINADCADDIACTDDACVNGSCVSTPNDNNCAYPTPYCLGGEMGFEWEDFYDCVGCCNPCLSQCYELGFCFDNPFDHFPASEEAKQEIIWLVGQGVCDGEYPSVTLNTCDDGYLVINVSEMYDGQLYYFDKITGEPAAYHSWTDAADPICIGSFYWPEYAPCQLHTVTEVLCGTALEIGDTLTIDWP